MVMEAGSPIRVHSRSAAGRFLRMEARPECPSAPGGLCRVALLGFGSIQAKTDFLGLGSWHKHVPFQSHFPHTDGSVGLGNYRPSSRRFLDDLAIILCI